jgi:radical SAM superfamily enzyme YgiQ (UPF0313 family)
VTRVAVRPLALDPRLGGQPVLSGFFPLGSLVAYAKAYRGGELRSHFDFDKVTPLDVRGIRPLLERSEPERPAVYLFSSYVWNHESNVQVATRLRRAHPKAILVLGGPHVPRDEALGREFLDAHPMFDVVARAEGEVTLAELLHAIAREGAEGLRAGTDRLVTDALRGVSGISFRAEDGAVVRTPDRPRQKELSEFPSPYTTGEFDHWVDRLGYMPVETNRGCPYGCSFCDWGAATLSKVHLMSLERVFEEVEFAARHRVQLLGFCDANFGILPRDLDIARHCVAMRERYGFPKEIGYTNAKVARPWLLEIYKILRDADLIRFAQISMQTTDETVLENVARANIQLEQYEKMITFFHQERMPVASDMMIGLPGQNLGTVRTDLQFFFDRRVLPCFFSTFVMPNAPMGKADYQRRFGISVGKEGLIESAASFTTDEYWRMFELCLVYKLFVQASVLKYLLYFMQVERGVPAVGFLQAWLEETASDAGGLATSRRVRRALLDRDRSGSTQDFLLLHWQDEQGSVLFDDLEAFHGEALSIYARRFGAAVDGSDLDAILAAQAAVMPRWGRGYPLRVELAHDVVGYFRALATLPNVTQLGVGWNRLADYAPGALTCSPGVQGATYGFVDEGFTSGKTLELASELAF